METVRVELGDRTYDVRVAANLLADAGRQIAGVAGAQRMVAVVSDTTVAPLHSGRLLDSLAAAGHRATLHTVAAGEGSKSMAVVENVCRGMLQAGHDRKSLVVALGGGVVGDLAGFVAAIFQRGVPYVQVPTTIVSQVDSSVGGKTGVNTQEGKNLLGAFHQPLLVLVDPHTLRTLPDREFREGFAEAIKHAAIRDAAMLRELEALDPQSRDVPAGLLARNIAIKARIVEADETETRDIRALLNFGHTIGHGIEAAVPYGSLLHGEAIAIGMRAALDLSTRHAGLPAADANRILALIAKFGLPQLLDPAITTDAIMEKLSRDKKFVAGQVCFVVLSAAGQAKVDRTLTHADLRAAIERLRDAPVHK
jgi:3-dehydroquinate synthase